MDDAIKININSVDFTGSICDGPGIRTILFLQGCKKQCLGCHNPQTWDTGNGKIVNISDLAHNICTNSKTKKLTISGGEPLLQKEAVSVLIDMLKEKGFDIALYTGYSKDEVPREIVEKIDFLKSGKYLSNLQTSVNAYIGSINQNFINLNDCRTKNKTFFINIEGDNGTGKDTIANMFLNYGFRIITYEKEAEEYKKDARTYSGLERTKAFFKYNKFCGDIAISHEKSLLIRYWISTLSAGYADGIFSLEEALEYSLEFYHNFQIPDLVFYLECQFDKRIERINGRNVNSDDNREFERSEKYRQITDELSKLFKNWYYIDTTDKTPVQAFEYMRSVLQKYNNLNGGC